MGSGKAAEYESLLEQLYLDEERPPIGSAEMANPANVPFEAPGFGRELLNSGVTEAISSRLGMGAMAPALRAGASAAAAMPGPPLLKGAAGILGAGVAGTGLLLGKGAIGGAVEAVAGLGDPVPASLSNAGVKSRMEKINEDFKRGAYSQAVGDMIGLGASGIGAGVKAGGGKLGSILNAYRGTGFGLVAPVSDLIRGASKGRSTDAVSQAGESLNAVLDSMRKHGELSAPQRLFLQNGQFQALGDSLVKDLSDAVGPHLDVGDFGKIVGVAQRGQHDLAQTAFERVYKDINDPTVMGRTVPGKADYWSRSRSPESAPAWADDVTARRFNTTPVRESTIGKYEQSVLDAYESLSMKVDGGITAEFKKVRPKLRNVPSTGRAAETTVVDEAAAFMNLMSALPDNIPYAQLDSLRQDTGKLIGKLTDARFKEVFVPQDLVGQMKQLYGKLGETQRDALGAAGMGEKANQLAATNAAYRQFKTDWNSKLLMQTRQFVEDKEPGKIYDMIADKSPAELREYFAASNQTGPKIPERFRGAWLGEGLFTRAVKADKATGLPSLDAGEMTDFIFKNEEKIKALFPDNPGILSRAKTLTSMVGLANSTKHRDFVKKFGINVNENGILFTRYATFPDGVRRVEFNMSPELITAALKSQKASESLFKVLAQPLRAGGRVLKGAGIRSIYGSSQESAYNEALMELEMNARSLDAATAISERDRQRKQERSTAAPQIFGPSL